MMISNFSKFAICAFFALFPALFFSCAEEPVVIEDFSNESLDPDQPDMTLWNKVPAGLHSGFVELDQVYSRSVPPEGEPSATIRLHGWKGERVNCQLLVWSAEGDDLVVLSARDFKGSQGERISRKNVSISPVRYVITDQFLNEKKTACGPRDNSKVPFHISPDMITRGNAFKKVENTTRPVWISIDIPADAVPGRYEGTVLVKSTSGKRRHQIALEVLDRTLPAPADWDFHLDLWQNPFAVARYHDVELWSDAHFALLKPLLQKLAAAGQKCITATIIDRPWGFDKPTYDDFRDMIRWTKKKDGTWTYDYSIFDKYVQFVMDCGITKQINCYSMVPIHNQYAYFDEAAGKHTFIETFPGKKEYEELWGAFLPDFVKHLKAKGWLEKTCVALDERESEEMRHLFRFLKTTAPELKISMAGFYFAEVNSSIYDFCSNWRHIDLIHGDIMASRKKAGLITTYYVACGIPEPNNFTFSLPAESCYEGWVAAAMGFDGFLRWAYNSWPLDPVIDTRFTKWPAGDTFIMYPDACSSVRFERLRDGIEDYIKIQEIRKTSPSAKLEDFLKTINTGTLNQKTAAEVVGQGSRLLYELSSQGYSSAISAE